MNDGWQAETHHGAAPLHTADTADIAVIGTFPRAENLPGASVDDMFRDTGYNTGNLAFAIAAHEHMSGTKTYYGWDFDPDELNERHQRAVLVCANMVNPHLD